MNDLAIITTMYIDTPLHLKYFIATHNSIDCDAERFVPITKSTPGAEEWLNLQDLNIINVPKNNVSLSWNIGIRNAIEKGKKYFLILNTDIKLDKGAIENIYNFIKENPHYGIASMTMQPQLKYTDEILRPATFQPMKNHDHSFSAFILTQDLFEDVGEFDTQFDPAYYEDDDYLYRTKLKGYTPMKIHFANFWHFTQSTMKNGTMEYKQYYNKFIQENKLKYIKKWGGIPTQEKFLKAYNGKSRSA